MELCNSYDEFEKLVIKLSTPRFVLPSPSNLFCDFQYCSFNQTCISLFCSPCVVDFIHYFELF
ncbi:hypothetical protein SLEP1_g60308 [Rubroshorea leprosula]|uniref:Uncharacterized protein n=1 Tax=Rubroshorea leprosula TaxID=152421 RepID=A0AAV5MXJ6_9ROSI|nr:hypothetical protein SLEP1_g60308 [Rubroshorea leprosula]